MKVFLHPKANEFLDNSAEKDRIKKKLKELEDHPKRGKPLKYSNYRSLRIGKLRAIYEIKKEKIIILYIGHRKNVYDDFSKLF